MARKPPVHLDQLVEAVNGSNSVRLSGIKSLLAQISQEFQAWDVELLFQRVFHKNHSTPVETYCAQLVMPIRVDTKAILNTFSQVFEPSLRKFFTVMCEESKPCTYGLQLQFMMTHQWMLHEFISHELMAGLCYLNSKYQRTHRQSHAKERRLSNHFFNHVQRSPDTSSSGSGSTNCQGRRNLR